MGASLYLLFILSLYSHAAASATSNQDEVTFNACVPVNGNTKVRAGEYRPGYANGARPSSYIIQRRMTGNIPFQNRTWIGYSYLFGDPKGDCWLGLSNIYALTKQGYNVLTINMKDWQGNSGYAKYSHFSLTDKQNYTLSISGFTGNVSDDLAYSNGQPFATVDRPDKYLCSINQKTGWWYYDCSLALLNGHYYRNGPYSPTGGWYDGIYWSSWKGFAYSLKYVEMILSRK